jgi:glycosyltransferase involved in cell wall biosynthesis
MKAARENNIPFLYYWIDVLHRLIPFKPFQPIGKIIESGVLRQADRVLVINEKLRDYVTKLGARPERTQVLRAGINLEQFKPNINLDAIRKQYRFKEEDIILFFMGWLYRFSGLKEITSRLAGSENNNFKLLIVGEGDAYKELQEIRERFNLQDRVILTGKKSYQEIPNLIAAANVCLLPAYPWEPIMQDIVPIKMYEYMAMKKPVISTKLPGVMKEFGEDNGVVYVDRPEDVVPKAIELVQNGKVEELGAKARSFVEKYSWDNITDDFEKILEEVIEEKHG